jgi:hypothetical protein
MFAANSSYAFSLLFYLRAITAPAEGSQNSEVRMKVPATRFEGLVVLQKVQQFFVGGLFASHSGF